MSDVEYFLRPLPFAYLLTIALEIPVLLALLSRQHPLKRKLAAGVWLTACTYPIVALALPLMFNIRNEPSNYVTYLIVAELFAPLAECAIFTLAFHRVGTPRGERWRDYIAITLANLASFLIGMMIPLEAWIGLRQ
ncbi:MAG: hypothetical protein WD768_12430 [Phycisphaeraceae bacterium]